MNNKSLFLKKFFTITTIVVFFAALIIPGVLFFVADKPKTSDVEKRNLTPPPKLSVENVIEGTYTDDLAKYYADNFISRDNLVKYSFAFKDMRGVRVGGVKIYDAENSTGDKTDSNKIVCIDDSLHSSLPSFLDNVTVRVGEKPITITSDKLELQNKEEYADLTKADLEGEKRNGLYVIGDTALEIFYGNESVATDYATVINAFRYSLPNDVKVFNEVIPSHLEFGLPSKDRDTVGRRQKPFIDLIYQNLDDGIIAVDGYSQIKNHYNNGEYLYFRSDHHWTARGAYYAYTAFAKAAGFTPVPLSDYETGKIDKFLGTFYSSYDKELEKNPDYVEYFLPFTEYEMTNYDKNGNNAGKGSVIYTKIGSISGGYLAFTGGDQPLSVIKTTNNTGRSIIVFKESYGNAFVPFLLAHYDTVYVADIRSFPFDTFSFIEDKGITDVLFLNSVMSSCTPARVLNIKSLLR